MPYLAVHLQGARGQGREGQRDQSPHRPHVISSPVTHRHPFLICEQGNLAVGD